MMLSRDDILKADDLERRIVDVPEWGGAVLVRALTGAERDAYEASLRVRRPALFGPNKGQMEDVPELSNARAKLVCRAVIDEDGQRLFTDQDAAALGEKSAHALNVLFTAVAEMSAMSGDAEDDAGKDSPADQDGNSTSA